MIPGRSENLQIEVVDSPKGAKILRLTGPLTLSTLFDFQNVSRRDYTVPILVDLSRVPYMDSAGLGAVVSLFASCQRTKRGFAIFGLADRIQTLFEVTHCDGLLPVHPDLDSADNAAAG